MPLGVKPICNVCQTSASPIWRKGPEEEVLCNSCSVKQSSGSPVEIKSEGNGKGNGNGSSTSQQTGPVRKSARVKPSKYRSQGGGKSMSTKGKNRRLVFKKNPIKAPTAVSTVVTRDYVFYDGIYWQVGDIASVMDDDGGIYYVQMLGFLEDQYCEKSAIINWLLPTTSSPKDRFDPNTYILGPAEELPRALDVFEFVCRAPADYYRLNKAPFSTEPLKPQLGYIWTRIGPQIRPVPSQEEIFGMKFDDDNETDANRSETSVPEKRSRKQGKGAASKQEKTKVEIKEEP